MKKHYNRGVDKYNKELDEMANPEDVGREVYFDEKFKNSTTKSLADDVYEDDEDYQFHKFEKVK